MMHKGILGLGLAVGALLAGHAGAAMKADKIDYTVDGKSFEGVLVYDDAVAAKRPAVVMAPAWLGITDSAIAKAKMLAGDRYAFFVADMYGADIRPKNGKEAGQASGAVRADLAAHRARINKAVDVLLDEGGRRGIVDPGRVAAIGFCFGGGNVLELARSGRDIKGVVTFHGALATPRPEDAKNIKAKILVLHGAADPFEPKANRDKLEAELSAPGTVDFQIVAFSGAVHSFTDPNAHVKGKLEYNPLVTKRAYTMMNAFFDEIF